MSIEQGEEQPKIGYIDGLLSTHFNECNIVAADTAKAANEMMADRELTRSARVRHIGNYDCTSRQPFDLVDLAEVTDFDHDLIAEGRVQFALAKHSEIDDYPTSLVAVFNNNSVVQLASFDQRVGGQCPYVQIGDEIEKDSIVVTQDSARTDRVEKIKDLMKTGEVDQQIVDLAHTMLDKYHSGLEDSLRWDTVDVVGNFFDNKHGKGNYKELSLKVVGDNEGLPPAKTKIEATELLFTTGESPGFINGHDVELVLGRSFVDSQRTVTTKKLFSERKEVVTERKHDDVLSIYAVVRGGYAVNLASFDEERGRISLGRFDKTASPEELAKLLPTFVGRNNEALLTHQSLHEAFSKEVKVDPDYRRSRGLLFRASQDPQPYRGEDTPVETIVRKSTDRYSYEWEGDWDWEVSVGMYGTQQISWEQFLEDAKNAFEGKRHHIMNLPKIYAAVTRPVRDISLDFIRTLGLKERVTEVFDPAEGAHEQIIKHVLGAIATQDEVELEGILTNRKVGKVITDVAARIRLSNGNNQVRLQMSGRPVSQAGFDYVGLFDESFILEGRNSESIDEDKAQEIKSAIEEIVKSPK